MAGLAPVELTLDCDACRLESGVVEVYDALVPACRFGLPATTRCKLCSATREAMFDQSPQRPLREIAANRCPACLHELSPVAIDERRCVSCGARAALVEIRPPTRLTTIADLEAALDAWAERENFPTRQALASATFIETDIVRLFELLQRGAKIEVLADPFANMGVRTAGRPSETSEAAKPTAPTVAAVTAAPAMTAAPEPPAVVTEAPPRTARGVIPQPIVAQPIPADAPLATGPRTVRIDLRTSAIDPLGPTQPTARPIERPIPPPQVDLPPPSELPPPSAPPRAIVYPLVSVIAADGEIHPEERALVDRFLQSEGLPPLAENEYCVHHPSEVAHFVPRERREDVVKLMCESAAVDGMPDESERRVIRAYATAWGVDDEKLDFWMWGYEQMNTSLTRALWLKLRRFVLSARWSDPESNE
jgi:uncharacterized tellurite resistance protein B-like protein